MVTRVLLDDVTSNGEGNSVSFQYRGGEYTLAQVKITGGTANIKLKGRLSSSMPWTTVHTFTSNGEVQLVSKFPEMIGEVTNIAGATVRLEVVD